MDRRIYAFIKDSDCLSAIRECGDIKIFVDALEAYIRDNTFELMSHINVTLELGEMPENFILAVLNKDSLDYIGAVLLIGEGIIEFLSDKPYITKVLSELDGTDVCNAVKQVKSAVNLGFIKADAGWKDEMGIALRTLFFNGFLPKCKSEVNGIAFGADGVVYLTNRPPNGKDHIHLTPFMKNASESSTRIPIDINVFRNTFFY